jgi:hypothetical protein
VLGFGGGPVGVGEVCGDAGDGFADGALRGGQVRVVVLEVFGGAGMDLTSGGMGD